VTIGQSANPPVRQPTKRRKRKSRFSKPARGAVGIATAVVCGLATLGALQFMGPLKFAPAPFAAVLGVHEEPTLGAKASADAFGVSMGVALREAMPADSIVFPLQVSADPEDLEYRWVPVARNFADTVSARPLEGSTVIAPSAPGVYRLAVSQNGVEQIITEPAVAVLTPFTAKVGGILNGYRIGTYIAERLGKKSRKERPDGFIQVTEDMLDLPVSRHFRIRDFITHDGQEEVWPKYVALDPRLLDKLELVMTKLASFRGEDSLPTGALDVHSGFRTPAFNRTVDRSAKDSRHQYGDAADVVVDADRDGRITMKDIRLITKAVEQVEREHPALIGGMGLYTSKRFRTPYVHIDARGERSRWTG
jgi:uncharacterized protein YcbK (DUF882 family)